MAELPKFQGTLTGEELETGLKSIINREPQDAAEQARQSANEAAISEQNAKSSEKAATLEANRAEQVAITTPYLSDKNTWMVWDNVTKTYKDSGKTGVGPIGPVGPIGVTGPKGDIGPVGPQGNPFVYDDFTPEQLKALTGPVGPKGDIGETGSTGQTGPKGDTGNTGPIGPEGLRGPKGDTGKGLDIRGYFDTEADLRTADPDHNYMYGVGLSAPFDIWDWDSLNNQWINNGKLQGADGKSAYEIAVKNGFVGTEEEWLESLNAKGDMLSSTYDPTGKARDVFAYADEAERRAKTFDVIIRTQAEFNALVASSNWLSAASVCFVGDGGTLEFTRRSGLKIPQTVKQIQGVNGAIIKIEGLRSDEYDEAGLWYKTLPSSSDYWIRDLAIECTTDIYGGGGIKQVCFKNCINLTGCTGKCGTTSYPENFSSVAVVATVFSGCKNLNNCSGVGLGFSRDSTASSGARVFSSCIGLVACSGTTEMPGDGHSVVFDGCKELLNCVGAATCTGASGYGTGGFSGCTDLTNCAGSGEDPLFAYGFSDCSNLANCTGSGKGTDEAESYGIGFNYCTRLANCSGHGIVSANGEGYAFGGCKYLNGCTKDSVTSTHGTFASDCTFIGTTLENVDQAMQELKDNPLLTGGIPFVTTYTPEGGVDGSDYEVVIPGLETLYEGLMLRIHFHEAVISNPILVIKGIPIVGYIRRAISSSGYVLLPMTEKGFILKDSVLLMKYQPNSNMPGWVVVERPKPTAVDLVGFVTVEGGGTGTDMSDEPVGNYLITNGAKSMDTKTPAEVKKDLGISYVYQCTGVADDVAISKIVNDFLATQPTEAGATMSMNLVVSGTLGLSKEPQFGLGNHGNPFCYFLFERDIFANKLAHVNIDWSNANWPYAVRPDPLHDNTIYYSFFMAKTTNYTTISFEGLKLNIELQYHLSTVLSFDAKAVSIRNSEIWIRSAPEVSQGSTPFIQVNNAEVLISDTNMRFMATANAQRIVGVRRNAVVDKAFHFVGSEMYINGNVESALEANDALYILHSKLHLTSTLGDNAPAGIAVKTMGLIKMRVFESDIQVESTVDATAISFQAGTTCIEASQIYVYGGGTIYGIKGGSSCELFMSDSKLDIYQDTEWAGSTRGISVPAGNVRLTNCDISAYGAADGAGGIYVVGGKLNARGCQIRACSIAAAAEADSVGVTATKPARLVLEGCSFLGEESDYISTGNMLIGAEAKGFSITGCDFSKPTVSIGGSEVTYITPQEGKYMPQFANQFNVGKPSLGDITEGKVVRLRENGVLVSFYVAKHDYENGLNGARRTLLVRMDCYDTRQWHGSNVNAYATSAIDSWLNGTYKTLFPADIQAAMGTTKFSYTIGNGNSSVDTLQRAVFLLSMAELEVSHPYYASVEGSALPIAATLKIAYLNGSANAQWTRSPYTNNTIGVWAVTSGGSADPTSGTKGSRPAFTLPASCLVSSDGTLTV